MGQESQSVLDLYTRRLQVLEYTLDQSSKRQARRRGLLIVLALFAVGLVYQSIVSKRLPIWTALFVIPAAVSVLKDFGRRRESLELLALIEYYESGIARLGLKWDSLATGSEFADPTHFQASDLDLFGRGSLFQILCSARTKVGRETLANWMKNPASKDEVSARRFAISELQPNQELREAVASSGKSPVADCHSQTVEVGEAN